MGRYVTFLAILALCLTETLSNPNDEADPLPDITEYEDNDPIDCEWKEWGECSGTCGEGVEVIYFSKFSFIFLNPNIFL